MKSFLSYVGTYWLSAILLVGLLIAIGYAFKNREKYSKNRFE
jgi:hypothetical protein